MKVVVATSLVTLLALACTSTPHPESGPPAGNAGVVAPAAAVVARAASVPADHRYVALSDGQRTAVLLHYYLDSPVADIADALGVTEGTVKTQLHRGRQALAAALGEVEP